MTTSLESTSVQTPAQWAVRWHGIVLAALLVFSVPVFHLTWHGILGHDEPLIVTRSQVPMLMPSLENVMDGTWMTQVDQYMREMSPIVWRLRGTWNETLFRFGLVQSDRVYLGREGWLYEGATVHPDVDRFDAMSAARRRVYSRVHDLVRASGAELVVSLVPDKVRVYPEYAYQGGAVSALKEPLYRRALQELRDEGIAVVDVAASMAAARVSEPGLLRYYQRDTHWRPEGALVAAQAVTAVIEGLPGAAGLSPRRVTELGARTSTLMLGGLVPMLGLLTYEEPSAEGHLLSLPMSSLSAGLVESRDVYSVVMRTGAVKTSPLVDDVDNEVLLVGTSFSKTNGAVALALVLGRPVRMVMKPGASGLSAIREVLDELRRGTQAKVVVWEIVERGLMDKGWEQKL